MKADFIPKFIEAIIRTGKEMHAMWHWEPLYYKGIKVKGYDRRKFYNGLENLKNRGILINDYKNKYGFTKKGKTWFANSLIKFHGAIGTKWDKKWRIVIFDIPQELHNKRNIFRQKLRSMGFYMLQKSVFVFPYECREELIVVCNKLKIGDYADVITAYDVGGQEEDVKIYFKL